jgi:hypothetical protein
MKRNLDPETENLLKSVAPKPAPKGLRERVLRAAARSRATDSATTPLLRMCLAGCAVILIVVSLIDGLASRSENARLQAVLMPPGQALAPACSAIHDQDGIDPVLDRIRGKNPFFFADGRQSKQTLRDLLDTEKKLLQEVFDGN